MAESVVKSDKLKKKQAELKVLKARLQKLEMEEKTLAKKQDTRRKILLGAYFLEQARKKGKLEELFAELDGFLTRNSDRALFGLKALDSGTGGADGGATGQ